MTGSVAGVRRPPGGSTDAGDDRARRHRRAPYLTAALVLGAWTVDLAFDPTSHHVPLCPFHAVTGLWCPWCGGLRAAWEIGHGDLAAALHDNVLFVLALPLLFGYWLDWTARARRGQSRRRLPAVVSAAVVVLAVAFWVVRNLPGAEFLRPL